ncbi:hypothetical protein JCM11491_000553 [Sporobolomyces phaffii]
MVALTAKTLSLPHLSLSRTSSPSRSTTPAPASASVPSAPPTPSTAPTSPSFFSSLDRHKSKSTSPTPRPVALGSDDDVDASRLSPIEPPLPPESDKLRRSSFGASLSASFSSSRSSSSPATATKSSTIPAGLSLTPASAHLLSSSAAQGGGSTAGPPAGGHTTATATAAAASGGFKPLQAAIAKSAGVVKDKRGALLMRSKSSDRAHEGVVAASHPDAATTTIKKKGVMGTVRGLALGQSVSQPAQSRAAASGSTPAATVVPLTHAHSGATTPTLAESGASSLASSSTAAPGGARASTAPHVHQLAESHVSQISLRMSEMVNKVFMPSAHGTAGQQADKLEGAFFVPSSAVQEATGGKGRPCPRVVKSREFGETLVAELHAANHDSYLLRTILRSSVLKALSLFLSRLSALLLVPSSPTDASFAVPLAVAASRDPKLQESDSHFAAQFPLALRYNLHIVRCATTVKRYLVDLASERAFPAFVDETLRPWRAKLTELVARVMNPVVASYKLAVVEACNRSRTEGREGDVVGAHAASGGAAARGRANSSERGARSLSLGRSSTPVPLSLTSATGSGPGGGGPGGGGGGGGPGAGGAASSSLLHGPSWLQDVTTVFDVCARLFARLDAKTDTDRWAVGIAIAATWKGMLGCSARVISRDGTVPASAAAAASTATMATTANPAATAVPAPVKNRLLGGVKKTPSPPPSPPLGPVPLGSSSTATAPGSSTVASSATIAFVRLIADLELFEHRLVAFLSATISSPAAVFHPSAAPVDPCPGAPQCGLCKTGRTFDPESDSSDDDDGGQTHGGGPPGHESRLALSAMREAMQALSSMIVVVRASRDLDILERALKADTMTAAATTTTKTTADTKSTGAPLTPSDLFALGPAKPSLPPPPPPPSTVTVVSPGPAHPECPTLRSAIVDLHPLILVHLVVSRVPSALRFRLPHDVWQLAGGWDEYASELRGFAAGEEWAVEVAYEVRGEVARVRDTASGLSDVEDKALRVLVETVDRVSRDAV